MSSSQDYIDKISNLYKKYSLKDIVETILISSLWLPNIASHVKHLLASSIIVTLDSDDFSKRHSIRTYSDFSKVHKEIFSTIPSFSQLEDYVPELDWGEVKFNHNQRNYKIMYGSNLEHPFDFLEFFKLFYCAFNEIIQTKLGKNPLKDLTNVLQMQNDIIEGLRKQANSKAVQERISPGYLEIPTKDFWQNARDFFNEYKIDDYFKDDFLNDYSINLGDLTRDTLKTDFENLVFSGKILNGLFLKDELNYFPILPRRFIDVLLVVWEKKLEKYNEIFENDSTCIKNLGGRLNLYIEDRVRNIELFRFVSAVNKEGIPDETIFSSAFVSRNKLVLLYLMKPIRTNTNFENELKTLCSKLKSARDSISSVPVTIGVHSKRMNAVFRTREDGTNLEPFILVITPFLSPGTGVFRIPKEFPARLISLDQFLGIIDELENVDSLSSFFDYIESNPLGGLSDLLDMFISFKLSHGVLIEGAITPHIILIDPHMGSNERFASLSAFWKLFPDSTLIENPRSWLVNKETPSRTRLVKRCAFESIIVGSVGFTSFFITSPLGYQNRKQIEISNFLMECLEDSLETRKTLIEKHEFFQQSNEILVIFIPDYLVKNNEDFNYLRDLDLTNKKWVSINDFFKQKIPRITIVYNEDKVFDAFKQSKDSSEEVELLVEILSNLNQIATDQKFPTIKDNVLKTANEKPRFQMYWINRYALFPVECRYQEPKVGHFKLARKKIAEYAHDMKLKPGYYEVEDAKEKIDGLRKRIVNEIDSIVSQYDLNKEITLLITQIDSLINTFEMDQAEIRLSKSHQVDYIRSERYAEKHAKYINLHRNNRYLIEKFVQLSPKGNKILEIDDYHYLIALIDWLHVLYQASDSLHYGIFPLGVTVTDDFLFEVNYSENIEGKENQLLTERAELQLGYSGSLSDQLESPRSFEDFFSQLDQAFKMDMNFGFQDMINTLQTLSLWPAFSGAKLNTYYNAGSKEIAEVCKKNIIDFDENSIEHILDFLTLKSEDVIRVLGQDEDCDDIPIWEHYKRYCRYTLKPIIVIDGEFYWGPFSTYKAGSLWSNNLVHAIMPFDIQGDNIHQFVDSERRLLEKELENKTFEISQRYSVYTRQNVDLAEIDKNGKHPIDLGDYDVLLYHPTQNIILNIECKHTTPPFCQKDAQRLRRTIFDNYMPKFIRRQKYLLDNYKEILRLLKWPINNSNSPKIVPIFLTHETYWWTRFPPENLNVEFIQIDLLSDFLDNLLKTNGS